MARFTSEPEAMANAHANANSLGVPYAVFTDTSGAWISERYTPAHAKGSWSGVGPALMVNPTGSVQAQPAAQFSPLTLEREYNEKGTRDEAQGRTSIEFQQNGVPIGMWIDFEEEGRGKRAKLFAAAPDLLSACKDLVSLIDVENHDVDSVTIKVRDLVPFVRAARAALGKATGSREGTPVLAHKQCSCCGFYAGMFRQHWNRDAGWGICRPCVLEQYRGKGESEAEILSLFGPEGVCWANEHQWNVEQRDEIALRR